MLFNGGERGDIGVSLGTELTASGAEPNPLWQGTKAPKCLKHPDQKPKVHEAGSASSRCACRNGLINDTWPQQDLLSPPLHASYNSVIILFAVQCSRTSSEHLPSWHSNFLVQTFSTLWMLCFSSFPLVLTGKNHIKENEMSFTYTTALYCIAASCHNSLTHKTSAYC